jgi:hypothetical protein
MNKKAAFAISILLVASPFIASAQSVDVQSQIASLLAQLKQLQALIAQIQGQGSVQSNCVNLSSNLTLGSSGSDVTSLQNYLITSGVLDSQYSTGYYGFITAKAVGTIQMNLNVLSSINDPAYGIVGPRTRAVLACGSTPVVPPTPPVVTSSLSAYCTGSPFNGGTPGTSWHVNASGGSGNYTYQWTMSNDVTFVNDSLGGLQTPSVMVNYGSTGTKNASVTVTDGRTTTVTGCSATIGSSSGSNQPSASLDVSSMSYSTGGKDTAAPLITGSASNVSQVSVDIKGSGAKTNVVNGRWQAYLNSVTPGTYDVQISDNDPGSNYGIVLARGSLTVTAPSTPAPYITSTSAKAAGNFEVDAGGQVGIFGTNLSTVDSTQVYIGGVSAPVIWTSDTQISATVPSNLTPGQSYDLYISNRNGTSNTVRVTVLGTVAPAPTINSINPSTATTNTAVTIYGANLSGVSSIQVSATGGQVVASLVPSSVTSTSVSFTLNGSFIGIQGPGTYQLAVVSSGGTSNTLTFTVNSPQPVASFDVSSMSFQTPTPLITGSASNVNAVSITIKGGGATANVVNGRWQAYLNGVTPGTYQVGVLDNDQGPYFNTTLATGFMTVSLQTASTNPRNLPQCPANSAQQRSQMGQTFDCYCPPGFAIQSIWGGPQYHSDNSDICTAGAQDGQINSTYGGEVDYMITAGQSSYPSYMNNGITSQAYGDFWPGSFQIVGPKG